MNNSVGLASTHCSLCICKGEKGWHLASLKLIIMSPQVAIMALTGSSNLAAKCSVSLPDDSVMGRNSCLCLLPVVQPIFTAREVDLRLISPANGYISSFCGMQAYPIC